jgi:hypothetical protein
MKKVKKEKKRRPRSRNKIIDGLPILRGMFVYPESLSDILPSFTELGSFDWETFDHQKALMEE